MKRSVVFFVTLVVALAVASLGTAGSASAAAGGNSIVVRSQDAYLGRVVVDSVNATQPSWLLIRKDAGGPSGTVLGAAEVGPGLNQSVSVYIRTLDRNGNDALSPTLWATLVPALYGDNTGPNGADDLSTRATLTAAAFASTLAGGSSNALASAPAQVSTGGVTSAPAVPAGPSTSSATLPGALAVGAISARAQDTSSGSVTIDSANASDTGWLLIRKDVNGVPGQVLGFAPVYRGINSNIRVAIRTTDNAGGDVTTPRVWAQLVTDSNAAIPFSSPSSDAQDQGGPAFAINTQFSGNTQLAGPLATTGGVSNAPATSSLAQVSVRPQDTTNGQVYVDSVYAAQNGWLLIRADSSGAPGAVLGYAPLHAGLNTGVVADIRTTNKNGDDAVTPTLWATVTYDQSALGTFAVPGSGIQDQGSQAAVPFSSTLAGGRGR